MLNNYTLSGEVTNMTMNVTGLKAYFKTKVTVQELQSKLEALEEPLINAINAQILPGYSFSDLLLIKNASFRKDFKKAELYVYDDFLLIQARPPVADTVRSSLDLMEQHLQKIVQEFERSNLPSQ